MSIFVKNQISQYSEKLLTIVLGWCPWIKRVFSWVSQQVWGEGRGGFRFFFLVLFPLATISPLLFLLTPPLLFSLCSSHSHSTVTPLPSFLFYPEPEWPQWPIKVERTIDNHLIPPWTLSQAQSRERSEDHDEYCPAPTLAWIFICLFFQLLGFYNLTNAFMIRNIFKTFLWYF